MHPLHKLMAKKKSEGKKLSGAEKKGKEATLSSLIDDMMDMDSGKVKGLKKVTIASDTSKGLKKGVEKAEEMLDEGGMSDEEMPEGEQLADAEEEMPEAEESSDMEMAEAEDEEEMSKEELLAEIDRLKAELEKAKA